jgi:hypothetical protein
MNAFIVDLKNQPGELARITEMVAAKGINLTGFSGATCGDSGTVVLTTSDEAGIRRVLTDGKFSFKENELVVTAIPDGPGSLAKVARRLADAGVNIEAALPTGMAGGNVHVAFATDNPTKAKSAVSEWLAMATSNR